MSRDLKPILFAYLLAAFPFLTVFCCSAFGANEKSLSIANPKVVNLSNALIAPPRPKAKHIELETLNNSTGQIALILRQSQPPQEDQDILPVGVNTEKSLVFPHRDKVSRTGKILSIKGQNGNFFRFVDWARAETNTQDGDGETFRYGGMLANTAYHKIDVDYIHDAPGAFLVNPETNSILYVHIGDDLASISENAQLLTIMNNGINPPFGIGVTNLQKAKGDLELHCRSSDDGRLRIIPSFKGWHINPQIGFDVVLLVNLISTDDNSRYEAIPVRFAQNNRQWHVSVPEPKRFAEITGISCWQQ